MRQASTLQQGVTTYDWHELDEMTPDRVRSVKDWVVARCALDAAARACA